MTFTDNTWDNVLTNGAGKFDLRLEIEGFPFDFVTSDWLTGPTGSFGKVRLGGLLRDGIKISYRTNLADRTLDTGGMNFQILDLDGRASKALNFTPSKYAILTGSIGSTDATIPIYTDYSWENNEIIHLGTEAIRIGNLFTTGSATSFVACTRGILDSVKRAYSVNNIEEETLALRMRDKPLTLDGRRCRVFAYGEDDDSSLQGTIVWRGRLKRDFEYQDGGFWEAGAMGIAEMFKEKLGRSMGEISLRGFWLPKEYVNIKIFVELNSWEAATTRHSAVRLEVYGFFESIVDILQDLDDQLQTWIASEPNWETTFNAGPANFVLMDDGVIALKFTTAATGSPLAYLMVRNPQIVVGHFPYPAYWDEQPGDDEGPLTPGTGVLSVDWLGFNNLRNSNSEGPGSAAYTYFYDSSGVLSIVDLEASPAVANSSQPSHLTVVAERTYFVRANGPVPGAACLLMGLGAYDSTISGENSRNRIYHDNDNINDGLESILDFQISLNDVKYRMADPHVQTDAGNFTTTWTSGSDGNLDPGQWIGDETFNPPLPQTAFYLTGESEFLLGFNVTRNGHVKDFLTDLANLSPEDGRHMFPNITTEDIDVDDMDAEYARATFNNFTSNLDFSYFKGDTKLEDIVEPEFFLGGLIPTVHSGSQKFTFRGLAGVSRFVPVDATINVSNTLRTELPKLQRLREHMISGLIVKTGWDPVEDEYLGGDHTAIDESAKVEYRTDNLTIERKATEREFTADDVREILFRNLSLLSIPYFHTTITCPLTKKVFNLVPGSLVRISTPHLPDPADGTRGIVDRAGLILGVNKDFGTNQCSLEIYFVSDRFGGYTPTAQIKQSSQVVDLTYEIIVASDDRLYSSPRSFFNDPAWFTIGDVVRFEEWNSWQPETGSGVITAINVDPTDTIFTVEFDDTPPAVSINSTARMRFSDYHSTISSSNVVQATWTYMADPTDPDAVEVTLFDI